VCLASCGSPRVRSEPSPAREPVRDALIEGELVDATTGLDAEGGVVSAKPVGRIDPETTWISDAAGRYRLELPAGGYQVVVYYGDTVVDRGTVQARARDTLTLDVAIDHAAVAEASAAAQRHSCPKQAVETPTSSARVETLVATVLDRFATDASTIPDGHLVPAQGTVYVAEEIDPIARVPASALPRSRTQTFVLTTLHDLQGVADRARSDLYYLRFTYAAIDGSCATVDVGVYVMSPSSSSAKASQCCCNSIDIYDEVNGRWVFRANVDQICS
jgi:hypothetical protein